MCGIAGSLWWDGRDDRANVAAMNAALAHRGPDADGLLVSGPATLAHRRLAIIDCAAAANQPLVDGDSGLITVFNGEIYNFRELRRDLEAAGARFATHGDTEVLVKAIARWGPQAIERFNGMFAFALWEPDARRLLLARDRLGKKPLFLFRNDHGVVFASELKALRRHPAVPDAIDPLAIGQFLAMNYVLGDRAVLKGVEKLPPAHWMAFAPDRPAVSQSYWDLAACFRNKSRLPSVDAAAEAVGVLLDDSVRLRLVSDVPLGAFLSGGLDSAAIAEAMARMNGGGAVDAFTIAFNEKGFSELPEACHTAGHLGLAHTAETVAADVPRLLADIVRQADEPFADTSMIPVWHLARLARRRVTVALSGDGGDEIFAGYPTYAADRLHHLTRWLPAGLARQGAALAERWLKPGFGKVGFDYKLRQFLAGHPLPFPRAHLSWRGIFTAAEMAALLRPERRDAVLAADPFAAALTHFDAVRDCHYLDQAMYVDIKTWLPDDILVKVDRMTMAHALEARAPLLDYRLVELAASLPADWKLKGFDKKHVFKRLLGRRLPAAILARPKAGFNAPVSHWLAGDLRPLAEATLAGPGLAEWVNPAVTARLWKDHLAGRRDHGFRLFGLVCLGLWLDQHAGIG
jgi:asparagine synthase (glutamine-hydrolysing)